MSKKDKVDIECGMYTINQTCARCNFSRSSLRGMLRKGTFPAATRIIGKNGKRWKIEVVETWRSGTDTPGPGRPRTTD